MPFLLRGVKSNFWNKGVRYHFLQYFFSGGLLHFVFLFFAKTKKYLSSKNEGEFLAVAPWGHENQKKIDIQDFDSSCLRFYPSMNSRWMRNSSFYFTPRRPLKFENIFKARNANEWNLISLKVFVIFMNLTCPWRHLHNELFFTGVSMRYCRWRNVLRISDMKINVIKP